jgi:hypothetical protein
MKIQLSQEYISLCENFAEERMGSYGLYNARCKSSPEKIKQDLLIGAMGECGTYLTLNSCGICTPPSFTILDKKQKDYSADLQFGEYLLHVKSQGEESCRKYGDSWILQYGKGRDPIFKSTNENEYLVLTRVDEKRGIISIKAIMSVPYLTSGNLIGEPKVKWLIGEKKAIYLKDLEGHALFPTWLQNPTQKCQN